LCRKLRNGHGRLGKVAGPVAGHLLTALDEWQPAFAPRFAAENQNRQYVWNRVETPT
jgi:hypothetical protein